MNPTQTPVDQPQPLAQPSFHPPVTQAHPPAATHDSGKVIGIIGFVFAFLPLQLIGLPLSIIAFIVSRKSGYTNGLAVAGIVINGIVVVAITALIILFAVTLQDTQRSFDEAERQEPSYEERLLDEGMRQTFVPFRARA